MSSFYLELGFQITHLFACKFGDVNLTSFDLGLSRDLRSNEFMIKSKSLFYLFFFLSLGLEKREVIGYDDGEYDVGRYCPGANWC